jgi:hypothetical protein
MKAKPVTAAPDEPSITDTAESKVSPDQSAEPKAEVKKEPITYQGKEIYDLKELAENATGAVISNPEGLTDLIFWGIEWVRSSFYPGMLYRIMFNEKERDKLEDTLSKFIDIDQVGESNVLIPIKKDLAQTAEEKKILIKWQKFVKGLNNLKYNEKEAATFKSFINDKVKNISIDSIIAVWGPVIGLMVMEAGKITPFIMNRKASIINTYTNR